MMRDRINSSFSCPHGQLPCFMQVARGAGRRVSLPHPCHMAYEREAGSFLLSSSQFGLSASLPAGSVLLSGRGAGPVFPSAVAGEDQGQLIQFCDLQDSSPICHRQQRMGEGQKKGGTRLPVPPSTESSLLCFPGEGQDPLS